MAGAARRARLSAPVPQPHPCAGGMDVSDAERLKALEAENARLKKLLAESMIDMEVTREAL